jgi:hypothetical protein
MAEQLASGLVLEYGVQGAQQLAAALVLEYADTGVATLRASVQVKAPWGAAELVKSSTAMVYGRATIHDQLTDAPWRAGAPLDRADSEPWGVAVKQDDLKTAPWGGPMVAQDRDTLASWMMATRQDDFLGARWGGPMESADLLSAATWLLSAARDDFKTAPWGGPMLHAELLSGSRWPASAPADGLRKVPWTQYSQQLHTEWSVVVPPDTDLPTALFYILPARFYMTAHTIFAQRLPDLADIPIFEATVAADSGSYCWSLQASGPASLFELLAPVDGLPVQLRVTLDGLPWVFAIDAVSRNRQFGQSGVSVQGRSVTALIGAPYLRATTRDNASGALLAQQLALAALDTTGIDLDWGLTDWLVPAGAWSHQGTPLDAVQAIAQAAGGYLQSHRSAATLLARHPYAQRAGDLPGAPWGWLTGAADVELATDALITEGFERKDGPDINAVYVSGTSAGVLALVKRTGSAADKLASMVTDPLITHADAARQRGLSVLGAAGNKYAVRLELPVLTGASEPGVLDVGQLVQVNASIPWRGRVRAVSVSAKRPSLRQTVTLERHLS